jgi:tRNA-specific 2-thiouridylase
MTTDIAPGPIVDPQGNVLGEHEGHQHFTVGQRRGVKVALGYPIYVVNKDAASNTITVGPRQMLASTGLVADETNWLVDPPSEDQPLRCDVKIRYNAPPVPGTAWMAGEDELRVDFDEPQDAVAPGQAVVCYDGERVLGGGWIARSMSGND